MKFVVGSAPKYGDELESLCPGETHESGGPKTPECNSAHVPWFALACGLVCEGKKLPCQCFVMCISGIGVSKQSGYWAEGMRPSGRNAPFAGRVCANSWIADLVKHNTHVVHGVTGVTLPHIVTPALEGVIKPQEMANLVHRGVP